MMSPVVATLGALSPLVVVLLGSAALGCMTVPVTAARAAPNNGVGVPIENRACKFGEATACAAACRHGNAESCNNLGAMSEIGEAVPKNLRTARSLYDQACTAGAIAGCVNARRLRAAMAEAAVEPPPPREAPGPAPTAIHAACGSPRDCSERCDGGDAASCKTLPGIHISGNVQIHGNVKMFGNVYLYGQDGESVSRPAERR
jgi:TPR repeat protein